MNAAEQIFMALSQEQQDQALAHFTVSRNGTHAAAAVAESTDDSTVPPLPAAATIDPDEGAAACPWLDAYSEWSRRMSPRGYDEFHEAVGLWLLSVVTARRLVVTFGQKSFYPSLYIALCAHTGLFAKTTTVTPGQKVLQGTGLESLLAPNDTTPQAFLNLLAGELPNNYASLDHAGKERIQQSLLLPGQKGWFYEEFGTKLDAMMRDGGFMADFRGILRIMDDHPTTHSYKTMTRHDRVEKPYLALLVNLTPADLRKYSQGNGLLWRDGFFARFAFVTPPIDAPAGRGRFPGRAEYVPPDLVDPLWAYHDWLGIPSIRVEEREGGRFEIKRDPIPSRSLAVEDKVGDAFYTYHDSLIALASEQVQSGQDDLIGNYSRFAEKAMRVAILLAGISGVASVSYKHWVRAQTITERWRAGLHHLKEQLLAFQDSNAQWKEQTVTRILRDKQKGSGTANDISKWTRRMSAKDIVETCDQLVKAGVLQASKTMQGTHRYSIPIVNEET